MNYFIFTYPQVLPKYTIGHGATEDISVLNPGPPVDLPPGNIAYKPANYDIYAADPAQRAMLIEVATEGNTAVQIFTACPNLKNEIIAQVKSLRQDALAATVKNAGVLAVYDENYKAAVACIENTGDTTVMKDGQSATLYLTGFGAQFGMTSAQFAAYIIGENRRVNPPAYQIEQEYLRLCYAFIPTCQDVALVLAAPADFGRFCGP